MKEWWIYFESYSGKTFYGQILLPFRMNERDTLDDLKELVCTDDRFDIDYKYIITGESEQDVKNSLNAAKLAMLKLPERLIVKEDGSVEMFDPKWN